MSSMSLLLSALVLAAAPGPSGSAGRSDGEAPSRRVRLHFELGGLGYQGNVTRLDYDSPAGASTTVERHGLELLGGGANVVAEKDEDLPSLGWFHSEIGRSGFHFGSTPTPESNAAAAGTPTPRHGFNFGLFARGRANTGLSFGRVCGFGLSLVGNGSLEAYTRSTVPGNRIQLGGGAAGGLHCHEDGTFALVQWSLDGNIGAEQMQDLRFQQGNDLYSRRRGTGLLLFPTHGPIVTLVHDGRLLHTALTGQGFWSFGRRRYGGRRSGVRADLSLSLGRKTAFGLAPWYEFDRIEYGAASKVEDTNVRHGHTFGVSFVYTRVHG